MRTPFDLSVRDLKGIAQSFDTYLKKNLGFDGSISRAEVYCCIEGVKIYLYGHDKFQQEEHYSRRQGEFSLTEICPYDQPWEHFLSLVWEKLEKAMPRDERELRHSMTILGAAIENEDGYSTEIGKMIAARIRKVRDDANEMLLTYQKDKK